MTITEPEVAIGAWDWHDSRPEMSSCQFGNSVYTTAKPLKQCTGSVQLTETTQRSSLSRGV
jgi:hypothetical protein